MADTKVLLDTNILIHREARNVVREDIGSLFRWIDKLRYEKCMHSGSLSEIRKHADPDVVKTLEIKLRSYKTLTNTAPDTPEITAIRANDRTDNDKLDTSLLAELKAGRVDLLITEDRNIHTKAASLGITTSVFTIEAFIEKATAENPEFADYKVLSVRKQTFGAVDLRSNFFDSFRSDYQGFDQWFNRKAEEACYTCSADDGRLVAFLYLKREGSSEAYSDITPGFSPANRLKIGTLKVVLNGFKLGERFLRIVFDNALQYGVDEIYVTIFRKTEEHERLLALFEDWGFVYYGRKRSTSGEEHVLVRNFRPAIDPNDPRRSYPYVSRKARTFIVPIYPEYHTELLPDSILKTESPAHFVENRPNRNAISKVYISRSIEQGLKPGDIIVFYRTGSGSAPAHYTAVATTLGIVQDVVRNIPGKTEFIQACQKRSVFTAKELEQQWDYKPQYRPFVVNFLYAYSLPKKPNLMQLKQAKVLAEAPRGFERLSYQAFATLLEMSGADKRLVVG